MPNKQIFSFLLIVLLIVSYNLPAQNVGIGTLTPAAPLHVFNTTGSELLRLQSPSPYISFYDNSGVYKGFLWKDLSNNLILGTSCANTSGNIKMQLACSDVFTMDYQGRAKLSGINNQLSFDSNGILEGYMYGSNRRDFNINAFVGDLNHGETPGNLILQTTTPGGLGTDYQTGNTGIGTASPTEKLEVSTPNAKWGIIHTNGTVRLGTYVGSNGGWVATQSNHPLYFSTSLLNANGSAQMALLQNGNVGIGTIVPSDKLEVKTIDGSYGIIHTNGTIKVGTYIGTNGGWFGTKTNHPLYFFTNDGSARMTVATNGNVGIGTTIPLYKLSVNGTIQTKEVRVETGWADFVFEKNHSILSLYKLEIFITKNKRLPGIPTAADIRENGLAVGEIQTKMMEKIEELTLYIIEQQKQIDKLTRLYNKKSN